MSSAFQEHADSCSDPLGFRAALGRFPTGVCIVTTLAPGGAPVGLTISSFSSVSLTPPLLLWSLQRSSPSLSVFLAAGRFAISVLAADQAAISNRFATRIADKFAGVRICKTDCGLPLIDAAAAHFVCRTWQHYDGGDHVIVLGQVERSAYWLRTPLVFSCGRYESLAAHPHPLATEEVWPIAFG